MKIWKRHARFELTANAKLKRKMRSLGLDYETVRPVVDLDPSGGRGYTAWMLRFLESNPEAPIVKAAVSDIEAVDAGLKKIPKDADVVPLFSSSVEPSLTALEKYAGRVTKEAYRFERMPSQAQFKVWSDKIVETMNFEAACTLHGIASGARRNYFCTGRTEQNYHRYTGSGARRFLVFPDGATEHVLIGKTEVPYSPKMFAVTVDKGALKNINDPNNLFVDTAADDETPTGFDEEGAETALALLNSQFSWELSLEHVRRDDEDFEEPEGGDPVFEEALETYVSPVAPGVLRFWDSTYGSGIIYAPAADVNLKLREAAQNFGPSDDPIEAVREAFEDVPLHVSLFDGTDDPAALAWIESWATPETIDGAHLKVRGFYDLQRLWKAGKVSISAILLAAAGDDEKLKQETSR